MSTRKDQSPPTRGEVEERCLIRVLRLHSTQLENDPQRRAEMIAKVRFATEHMNSRTGIAASIEPPKCTTLLKPWRPWDERG
jgi:hypothetical protein